MICIIWQLLKINRGSCLGYQEQLELSLYACAWTTIIFPHLPKLTGAALKRIGVKLSIRERKDA